MSRSEFNAKVVAICNEGMWLCLDESADARAICIQIGSKLIALRHEWEEGQKAAEADR